MNVKLDAADVHAIAVAVAAELRAGDVKMTDQAGSPLGRRRHIAAVRRRVATGEPGACIVARRYLLSPEALAEELAAQSKKPRKVPAQAAVDDLADLRAQCGLRRAS